jgi:hypothetical protein
VHKILTPTNRKVTANRSGRGILRIRGTHESAHDLPSILRSFHDGHECRALSHEFHELVVIRFAVVLGVVARRGRPVNRSKLRRDKAQLLALEARNDLAHEAARDAIRLHNEKGSIHDGETYQP